MQYNALFLGSISHGKYRYPMECRDLEKSIESSKPDHYIIESGLLGNERFILALEKGALRNLRAMYPDMAIYFQPELEELIKFKDDIEHIRAVHKLKKKFNGWIVPSLT